MEGRILTCVYCGHEYPQDTPAAGAQILTDHIKVCEKHPLRKAGAMKKLTEIQKAIRVVDATMRIMGGPGSAQEQAWAIVKRAAETSEGPQPAPQVLVWSTN